MEKCNTNYIDALSDGNKVFRAKLIATLKEEFPNEFVIYFDNVDKDLKKTAESVHKLKHKIGILGLEKSYDLAIIYEENLRKHSLEGKESFELILDNMYHFINKL
ncbi:histidine kinase [Patiriisocius marinistellae]|uniref:Histidine kinase n=1 Tax=Patiriisocius marinistellae TaxID=2494560 RepID=A0A5J4FWH3_9FLAO|nr:Hpt domain-containing protein [Patiriisocius marinistellae]GEQ87027.1 histidine kinase [Patiriisocius marinistellae]